LAGFALPEIAVRKTSVAVPSGSGNHQNLLNSQRILAALGRKYVTSAIGQKLTPSALMLSENTHMLQAIPRWHFN
jgi:hypothetical protein